MDLSAVPARVELEKLTRELASLEDHLLPVLRKGPVGMCTSQ